MKTCISAPALPSATGGRVSGLVPSLFLLPLFLCQLFPLFLPIDRFFWLICLLPIPSVTFDYESVKVNKDSDYFLFVFRRQWSLGISIRPEKKKFQEDVDSLTVDV